MSVAEMIFGETKLLPKPLAQQVLDFVVAAWISAEDDIWDHV